MPTPKPNPGTELGLTNSGVAPTWVATLGFAPGFPLRVADTDDAFAESIAALLDDDHERAALGAAARGHVRDAYSAARWTKWARSVLERADAHGHP